MTNNSTKSATVTGSTSRFAYAWGKEYADFMPLYREQFLRWTPFFSPSDWKGKTFLDVGCGMGRNSYWPMTFGAAGGKSIDLDENTLTSARKTLEQFPSVEVTRQSAYDIAETNKFDIAFSIGVIHHLESPQKALKGMVQATKPGGQVLIWVYGYENVEWVVNYFNPFRQMLFSKLPIGLVHHLSLYPTAALWAALRLGLGKIEYYNLLRRYSFKHLRSTVFDQMLPSIANYWRKDEVQDLMQCSGLVDIKLEWVNQMSWAAIGTKPQTTNSKDNQ